MLRSSVSPNSKPNCSPVWLICFLLGLLAVHTHAKDVLTVPQQVTLSPNYYAQQLSISWLGGAATTFDLMILRTELNETVFYETVPVTVNEVSGRHQWNWTSVEPLECTSLSIKIRSRQGQTTSQWSNVEILQGSDLPSIERFQMYPQDRVVPVGANTTFCCIVKEGRHLGTITYRSTVMNMTRLSRRSYAITAINQEPSGYSGTNVICYDDLKTDITGAVVFVGYPPLPTDFVCETRDLTSAVCHWKKGRDTHLIGKRKTLYSLNKSRQEKETEYSMAQWEDKWTLVAVNPLGQYSITDSADIRDRVRPVAPENLTSVTHAWNATVKWEWTHENYSSLDLLCQVELTSQEHQTMLNFSGEGLRSAVVSDLYPDEDHSVRVRCGAQQNFWRWGDWSEPFSFKTNIDVPDAPDVWKYIKRDNTGKIIWKPLTHRQSHGQITGYEVTLWSPEENIQHTKTVPPNISYLQVNLTQNTTFTNDNKVIATVIAKNAAGVSQSASVVIPLHWTDVDLLGVSRVVYMDGGFPLSWQSNANATCGYVVEWQDALCIGDCPVEWIKLGPGNTNVSIESANFQPGVRYNIFLYSCSSELLQRWQGYMQELVPSSSVPLLSPIQRNSNIFLSWGEIPLVNRRGYLLGYNVYISNGSQLTLLANLSDPGSRTYTVKGLPEGSYKFTVKAYTSAGEDRGATASITMEPYTDWLILEILASLGITSLFLVIVTLICYKKRKWVKTAFYPDIPEPKLSGDWSRKQGPLDVKPSPHSMVRIVDKPDWDSKEVLVVIPEEDEEEDDEGQGMGDEPIDTDEPTSLRYYNQVVDDRPIRPRFPDSSASSASSLDSAHTDVTYTGIQTSGSSLVFQLDPQGSSEGHQPQADLSVSSGGGGGGYRPQMQPRAPSNDLDLASTQSFIEPQAASAGGYKPQCSWHLDSPVEAEESGNLAPCLGSPTSVASTQFLLPDGGSEEHEEEKRQLSSSAATWLSNLLSSTKP